MANKQKQASNPASKKPQLNYMVAQLDDGSSASKGEKLNALHGVNWKACWKTVSEESMVKCFRIFGFIWDDDNVLDAEKVQKVFTLE